MTESDQRFHPKSVSDVLVEGFELLKADWTQYVLIAALLVVPLTLVEVAVARSFVDDGSGDVTMAGGSVVVALLGAVFSIVVQLVVTGALTRAGVAALAGEPIVLADSLGHAWRRLGGLLWVVVLSGLAILAGFIALIVPGIILAVLLSVSVQAFVVEGARGPAALARSWNLVKGHFWHVLGVVVLLVVATGIATEILGRLGGDSLTGQWLFNAVAGVLVIPYSAMVAVVLYVELRAREGGLTVAELRSDLARTTV